MLEALVLVPILCWIYRIQPGDDVAPTPRATPEAACMCGCPAPAPKPEAEGDAP